MRYYLNLREQKEFAVDQAKLQEYFPLQVVIDGTFKIYQVSMSKKNSVFFQLELKHIINFKK